MPPTKTLRSVSASPRHVLGAPRPAKRTPVPSFLRLMPKVLILAMLMALLLPGVVHLTAAAPATGGVWTLVESPVTTSLRAVRMVSPALGFAVGGSNTFLKFNGQRW